MDLWLSKQSGVSNSINTMRVHIVTPMGNHSLPTSSPENRGPSSLLDRWRSGGGCDCGGWDMGCPLIVFSNQTTEGGEEYTLLKSTQPCEIFLQGAKERTPALTIRYMRRRQYTIDFHAQLSILQAFAVCVAILHMTTEAPASVDLEKNKQLLQYNPMKVLVEDEVKRLIEAVTGEENEKGKEMKDNVREVMETGQQPYLIFLTRPFTYCPGIRPYSFQCSLPKLDHVVLIFPAFHSGEGQGFIHSRE